MLILLFVLFLVIGLLFYYCGFLAGINKANEDKEEPINYWKGDK